MRALIWCAILLVKMNVFKSGPHYVSITIIHVLWLVRGAMMRILKSESNINYNGSRWVLTTDNSSIFLWVTDFRFLWDTQLRYQEEILFWHLPPTVALKPWFVLTQHPSMWHNALYIHGNSSSVSIDRTRAKRHEIVTVKNLKMMVVDM